MARTHSEDPIRIALVGLGNHGRTIQEAVALTPGLEVAAVYDLDEAEERRAAERFGCDVAPSYEALVARDDLRAVALTTPNHLHRMQVEAALARGLDVFVEKPIANTVADGRAMVEAAAEAGRILMVGHNMRYAPAARRTRALLEEGRLGEVTGIQIDFSSDSALRLVEGAWRLRPDQCPLLPMMQLGIHAVDLVHYLFGSIREVFATARTVAVPAGVVDSVAATFVLDGGLHGTLLSAYSAPVRFAYRIAGTGGAVDASPHTMAYASRTGEGEPEAVDDTPQPYASYAAQMAAFAEAVRTQTPPEADGAAGLQALAVVEAMQESIERHAPVRVADVLAAGAAA